MKRKIVVTTKHVRIAATIVSRRGLTRDEVESARDELADTLMKAAADVRYHPTPLSRVKVQ